MTTLITIPNAKALHVPTKGATPLPLAQGDLLLTVLPADPPSRPSSILSLSVAHASFPLLPNSPLHRVQPNSQHASYLFSPIPSDGGQAIGSVLIQLADSKNQGEWEALEALSRKFEDLLKEQGVWEIVDENDEDDSLNLAGSQNPKGWGETIGDVLAGAGKAVADRLTAYTDRHVESHPAQPEGFVPSADAASTAASIKDKTGSLAESATSIAQTVGQKVHDGGVAVGQYAKSYMPESTSGSQEKSELRKGAEEQWEQVTLAAAGTADGAKAVGQSVSDNSHRAIEHNGGPRAEAFAQDVGQAGANVGAAALSATTATSAIVQGANASDGARQGASA